MNIKRLFRRVEHTTPTLITHSSATSQPASTEPKLKLPFVAALMLLCLGAAPAVAGIVTPEPGSTLQGSSVTVHWQPDSLAKAYYISVGTTTKGLRPGAPGNLSFTPALLATSQDVFDIPLNGKPVYLRLWIRKASGWQKLDYAYNTVVGEQDRPARITAPLMPGPLSSGSIVEWSGHGVSEYKLSVRAKNDETLTTSWSSLYTYRGSATSAMLNHIPDDGAPVYLRLWSKILSKWFFEDYIYESGQVGPAMLTINSPASGVSIDRSAKRFAWAPAAGASKYVLTLASSEDLLLTPLHADLFSLSTTETEAVATGIPLDGENVYVRLWALVNDEWFHSDSMFSTTYSTEAPDAEAECLERRWQKVSQDVQGQARDLLWREPSDGVWKNGAIILLHGGSGSSSNWCSETLATHNMHGFAQAALDAGFAVFALDADTFTDAWGQSCGKRFDALSPEENNRDLRYIEEVLTSTIAGLRPEGSSDKQFMTGISSGALMTVRAATRFDSSVSAFTAVAGADPYGTYLYCGETPGQEQRPGFFGDLETYSPLYVSGACNAESYPNESAWESEKPAELPPFKLLHHRDDAAIDVSCMEKARQQLISHGYKDRGSFFVGDGVQRNLMAHFWQPEFSEEIIKFFSAVADE